MTTKLKPDLIANSLTGVPKKEYGDKYSEHLLEQYKMYLQLADKISERRTATNTFFLTVNTGLISAIGIANLTLQKTSVFLFIIVGLAGILFCYSWYRLIRSHRDLNTAKLEKVIPEIEKQLPIRPYTAEWEAAGRGENNKLYLPFTRLEIYVPWIFMALHIAFIFYGFYLQFKPHGG